MTLSEINPCIRFAEQIDYRSAKRSVFVKDCRLFYILSGRGEIFIEDRRHILTEGALLFCRENSVYDIVSEEGLALIVFNFDLTQKNANLTDAMPPVPVEKATIDLKRENEKVRDCDFINSHIYIKNGKNYSDAINDIVTEFKLKKLYFREKAGGILKGILIDIVRGRTLPTDNSISAVSSIINYINTNFKQDIKNEQLAKMVGYHEYHLNRLFLRHTGQSIHQYILTRRLNEAKKLLLGTDLPLTEISERCGFNSSSHFSTYFKRMIGLSPNQYRASFRNNI